MSLHSQLTVPIIILASCALLGAAAFAVKKFGLSEGRLRKNIFLSFALAILLLASSLLYTERRYGGSNFLYVHGLPHFYLIEENSGEDMSQVNELKISKNIFMNNDLREMASGVNTMYLIVNFMFWYLASFCLLAFSGGLRRR